MFDLLDKLGQATGKGVRIAIIDTGVEAAHPLVGGKLLASYHTHEHPDGLVEIVQSEAKDVCGHGTAAASQAHKMAPDADIISVRVLSEDRAGTSEALVAALSWLTTQQIDLVNLSLSTMRLGLALRISQAIDALYARNICCLCARGYHKNGHDYPTSFASTIGITYADCAPSELTYRSGSLVEFAASGVDIETAWLGGSVRQVTGSSYATPLVTGLAARLRELHAGLTPYEIKSLLKAYAIRRTEGWHQPWMDLVDGKNIPTEFSPS